MRHLGDQTLRLHLIQQAAGQGAVDAMTVNHHTNGDQFVSRDFLHDLVVGGLVNDDGVLGLLLGLSLRPLLLLGLSSGRRGWFSSGCLKQSISTLALR